VRELGCGQNLPIFHKIFPSPNRKNLAGDLFWSVRLNSFPTKWPLSSILMV
jgi:hypothetical protein